MRPLARAVVRVPASTSNLGPGFDCFGLALALYNELTLELYPDEGPDLVRIEGEGQDSLARDSGNLMVRAARLVVPQSAGRLVFKAVNCIPLGRGLGSSAAAALAGLYAGNAVLKPSARRTKRLFEYACRLEGHPDNAAAAVHGGLTACVSDGADTVVQKLRLHKNTAVVVCVPDYELATKKARAALPKKVPLKDAVANVSRSVLLTSALAEGNWARLALATEDRLHQPYRAPLVRGLEEALTAARKVGSCGAFLSGAGPSVAAVCLSGLRAVLVGRRMKEAFAKAGVRVKVLTLNPDLQGVRIIKK